jgi:3-deoxy-manno-octulosonate cytidylyltransferase (CMP-KDO synthetase)
VDNTQDAIDYLIVIPARYRSTRLPGKPLIDIAGKPMIIRTAERCLEVAPREQVVVATDDERIAEVCRAHNIRVEMTRDDHRTGSDRVAEVAARIPARAYINVQGDEPVFDPDDIRRVIDAARQDPTKTYIGYCDLTEDQWSDTKYLKLLFGLQKQLIYIGRAQVPGSHDGAFHSGHRQVCVHSYPRAALEAFSATSGRTPLEAIEDHEMMRFLELGLPVEVVELSANSLAVDRPSDIALVEQRLREMGEAD